MTQTIWNTALYNQNHDFVTHYGKSVIELLSPQPGELILDLGCGSGELTAKIAENCRLAIGCDAAQSMIKKARSNYPQLEFIHHNAEYPLPLPPNSLNAVFSNAALHWMMNATAVAQNVYTALQTGGRFVFEMGGDGNVAKVLHSIQLAANDYNLGELTLINFYPTLAEYAAILEKVGFSVTYATLFERPTLLAGEHGLANWVVMFRNSVLAKLPPTEHEAFLASVENHGKPMLYSNNQWVADYVRLRMVAYKKCF